MTSVLWFKRDLRLADHPALEAALRRGAPVVCLYIVEPDLWAQPDYSGRQYQFLCESLRDLARALQARGADLVIRVGEAVGVLEAVRAATGADQLFSHEETGNGWTYARDRRVADWAAAQGVHWQEIPQCGVVRRLDTRDTWAARRNRFMAAAMSPEPDDIPSRSLRSEPVPALADLGFVEDCRDRQTGGRQAGLDMLQSFLTDRGRDYRRAMSTPLEGSVACSRLSPHLAFGTLSVREAVQAGAARQRAVKGSRAGWGGSLKSFQSRLAWRDHFMQKLEDEPALEWRCLHRAYETLRPRSPDATRLAAWEKGETGLPFVDACMRSLNATGWLSFRMRSMLMSFASYHLWLDWRVTGKHLARMFTDYEPGIHWSQCQMQSGTTGINTLRIYNPVKQGHDQDPTGAFTRAWVPELSEIPDAYLQEPWNWDAGTGYPAPIVDVKAAAKAAKDAIWAVRKSGDRTETARVIEKHASRKDPQRHFVNDRAPRREAKAQDDRQASFDF